MYTLNIHPPQIYIYRLSDPVTGPVWPRGWVDSSMTATLEGGELSAARPGRTLPLGKTRYPLYRRLGGPQGRSGRAENLVPTGIRSRTVQPLVSRYTDWATRPTIYIYIYIYIYLCVCVRCNWSTKQNSTQCILGFWDMQMYSSVQRVFINANYLSVEELTLVEITSTYNSTFAPHVTPCTLFKIPFGVHVFLNEDKNVSVTMRRN